MEDKQAPIEPTKENTPKPKNTKKIVIIVVSILLLLCCVTAILFGAGGFFFYKGVSGPVGPIKDQLKALNEGNIDKAYEDYASKEFKRQTNLEAFKKVIEQNPQIFKSKDSSFNNVKISNGEATVKGKITGKDGTVTKMTYKLIQENDKWFIYGFQAD